MIFKLLLLIHGLAFAAVDQIPVRIEQVSVPVPVIPDAGSITVTPGTGTWAVGGSATVTPGTGTWPVSGTFNQGSYTITAGTGVFQVAGGTVTIQTPNGNTVALPVSGPLTDAQLRATSVPVINNSTITIQSLDGNTTPIPIVSFGTTTIVAPNGNTVPIPVNIQKSTIVIQGSDGSVVTVTGNSLNVNCTGGCGTTSLAATFLALSTATLSAGATPHFTLMNTSGSPVVVKVRRIEITSHIDAAVTGLPMNVSLRMITAVTRQASNNISSRAADTNDILSPFVQISTGGIPTFLVGERAIGIRTVTINPEETVTLPEERYLYDYKNAGEKPLTLRAGQGVSVTGPPIGALIPGGKIGVNAIFTTE